MRDVLIYRKKSIANLEDYRMKKILRCLVGLVSVAFLITAYSVGTKATEAASNSTKYIEVCSQGIVYVPPDTQFVRCHGRVMRVIGIVPLVAEAQRAGDCNCPNCCGGFCAVTISCPNGGLCTMYLAC